MKVKTHFPEFLFPTIVNKFQCEETPYLQSLSDEVLKLSSSHDTVHDTYYHEGLAYTTSDNLQEREEFAEAVSFLTDCFKKSLDVMAVQYDDVHINCMWANVSGPTKYYTHNTHTHPNSFLSCAFYIDIPSDYRGVTFFQDPRPARDSIIPNYREDVDSPEKYNSWYFETPVGCNLVFPSWLAHKVPPVSWEDGYRIVISANMMPISDCKRQTQKSFYRKPVDKN